MRHTCFSIPKLCLLKAANVTIAVAMIRAKDGTICKVTMILSDHCLVEANSSSANLPAYMGLTFCWKPMIFIAITHRT